MDSIRQEKISNLVHKELSDLFRSTFNQLAPSSMITVTTVRVSSDLGLAKVYLSIFGPADKEEAIKAITGAKGEIRYALGKLVGKQLRKIPDLAFYLDDTLDEVEKINKLLGD